MLPSFRIAARCAAVAVLVSALSAPAVAAVFTPGQSGVTAGGASQYGIGIAVPPGTAGMQPALSLSYSSGSGDGYLGVGFGIAGLSAVQRCPAIREADGQPDPIKYDANDKFCLDGQRLVKIGTGTYGANGTEYRTEAESLTKIISNGTAGTGPAWFQVWTPDGLIKEYGNTSDSRAEATGLPSVSVWALNKVADRKGNYFTLTYTEDAATGEQLLSRIDYTGNAAASLAPYNSVQFVYEARPDEFTNYIGVSGTKYTKRLNKVQTFTGTTLVREYRLAYELAPVTLRSRVTTITECAGDGSCLPATTFAWRNGGGGLTQTGATAANTTTFSDPVVAIKKGDFDKNGFMDAFIVTQSGANQLCYGPAMTNCVSMPGSAGTDFYAGDFAGTLQTHLLAKTPTGDLRLCTGGLSTWPYQVSSCPIYTSGNFNGFKLFVGDFDGDGKEEVYTHLNGTGQFCTPAGCVTTTTGQNFTGMDGHVKDFDGDGRADIFFASSGASYFCSGKVLSAGGSCTTNGSAWNWQPNFTIVPGDFNGDGHNDLLLIGSTGSHFCAGPNVTTTNNCASLTAQDYRTGFKPYAGDFNGDGFEDVMMVSASGAQFCPGPDLVASGNCTQSTTADWSTAIIEAGDFNGNGPADLYLIQSGQGKMAGGGSGAPDFLASVTNGIGTVTSFTYKPLTDSSVYSVSNDPGTQPIYMAPLYVVSNDCMSDGIGGNRCNDRWYYTARWNKGGRGFVGFQYSYAKDLALNRTQRTFSGQSFPQIGTVFETIVSVPSGEGVSTSTSYTVINTAWGRTMVMPLQRNEVGTGLDGIWKNHYTQYEYDTYGNITKATTQIVGDVYRRETTFAYDIDYANWLLGRAYNQQVKTDTTDQSLPSVTRVVRRQFATGSPLVNWDVDGWGSTPYVQNNYVYDAFGNVTSVTTSGTSFTTRTNSATYDTQGRFAVTATNALNQTTTTAYDARFGVPTSVTDPNNLAITWAYDNFGRKTQENRPDGTQTTTTYSLCAACVTTASNAAVAFSISEQSTGSSQPVYSYFDVLGRPVASSQRNFADNDWLDNGIAHYNGAGQVVRRYLPHFRNGVDKPYTTIAYHSSGRVASETAPDNGVTTYSHVASGTTVTSTIVNAKNQGTTNVGNFRGQVTSVTDMLNNTVTYGYDVMGNRTSITDPNSNQITFTYDHRGRKTGMVDPNMGTWSYTYDGLNQLLTQTDGASNTTTLTYDLLGRKLTQSVPGTQGIASTWVYDTGTKGIGKVASITSNNGVSHAYTYDSLGRLSVHSQTVDGQSYADTRTYDSAGRLASLVYPTGYAINYVYSALGYQSEIRNASTNTLIWRVDAMSAAGITDESYGNGTGVTRDYQSQTYRENRISHVRDSDNALLQRWEYSFDLLGNTTQRSESFGAVTENYVYDNLNRLASSNLASGTLPKAYGYDAVGNFTTKSDVFTQGLGYYVNAGNAATKVAVQGGAYPQLDKLMTYNNAGAATGWDNKSISNTPFNLPYQINQAGSIHTWKYDAHYERVKYTTSTQTKTYLRGGVGPTLYEKIEPTAGATQHRHYIWAASLSPVAQITTTTSATQVLYLHADRLGSVTLVTDEGAQALERFHFDAYGKRRNVNGTEAAPGAITSSQTSIGYTGHEQLDALNLIHMNGRIYDPYLGKFLQADPVIQPSMGTQGFNRYSYVHNNPLFYIDPTGFEAYDPARCRYRQKEDDILCVPADAPGNIAGVTIGGPNVVRAGVFGPRGPSGPVDGAGLPVIAILPSGVPGGIPVPKPNPTATFTPILTPVFVTLPGTFTPSPASPAGPSAASNISLPSPPSVPLGSHFPFVQDGENAVQHWLRRAEENGLYHIPGFAAYLWTPDTAVGTTIVIGVLGARAAQVRFLGPMQQWVRIGQSYSRDGGFQVSSSIRWGASPSRGGQYIRQIPSQAMRDFNQWLRARQLPGDGWRTADPGHFHLWR